MATDDFFLNFGSDAKEFSAQLGKDLSTGVSQVNALSDALLRYDETVGKVKNTKNPLGNVFTSLDQAGAKLESIGNELASQFSKIISSVGSLTTDLKAALDVVHQAGIQVKSAPAVRAAGRAGDSDEYLQKLAVLQRQDKEKKRHASQVTERDLEAAASGRGKSPSQVIQARTMEQLNRDAVQARNNLRNVANASATVARNADSAKTAISQLGNALRTLTTQTKTTTHGVTEGRFQHVQVNVAGGAATVGQSPVVLTQLLQGISGLAQQGPVLDDAHQAARAQAEERRKKDNAIPLTDLAAAAQPGYYRVPGEKDARSVSARINPGESFGDYFGRVRSNSSDLDKIRQQVRVESEGRLGVAGARDIGQIQNLIGRKGLDQLLGNPKTRNLEKIPGTTNQEQVRASLGEAFAPSKALTPAQYEKLPEVIADFARRLETFNALSERHISERVQSNPLETFALGGRADGGDVFGRNQDFYAALEKYDDKHKGDGALFRQDVAGQQAERQYNARNSVGSGYAALSPAQRETAEAMRQQDLQRARNSFIDPKEAAEQDKLVADALKEARSSKSSDKPSDRYAAQAEQGLITPGEAAQLRLRDSSRKTDGRQNGIVLTPDEERKLDLVDQYESTKQRSAAGGGGGNIPPGQPPIGGSFSEPDDEGRPKGRARSGKRGEPVDVNSPELQQAFASLSESFKLLVQELRAKLPTATGAERTALLQSGAAAFKNEPLYREFGRPGGGGTLAQQATLRDLLGLPVDPTSNKEMRSVLGRTAGAADRINAVGRLTGASLPPPLDPAGSGSEPELTRAQSLSQGLFGKGGFAKNQLRHIGLGVENIVGYSLVFTGFEKLKELAHTGIETDAAFVRLQASLDATGRSAGHLRTDIAAISANTATPIQNITEAASELVGVFQNSGDLAFGTKIAAQLANISQGTLTAKEAAVGLRDVTDAYGITGTKGIQAVGDQIAHLSQLTGVSVKDITEGTTQIAQTSKEFGLSQPQASVLSAYISRDTGLPGAESAAQASRLLGSLQKGPVADLLIKSKIATQDDFNTGNYSNILTGLMTKYRTLPEPLKRAISSQLGQGQQERAFSAITNVDPAGAAQFANPSTSAGALNRQNAQYLSTVAGSIKQLDENFQNLGNTLARLGAFDFLGVLAKSLNTILATVNTLSNRFADLFGGSAISTGVLHITTTVLEAAAAFKLLGGVAASGLGKIGLRAPSNAGIIAAAKANNIAAVESGATAGIIPAAEYGRIGFPGGARISAARQAFASQYATSRDASLVSRGLAAGGGELGAVEQAGASLTGLGAAAGGALVALAPLAIALGGLAAVAAVATVAINVQKSRNNNRNDARTLATGGVVDDSTIASIQGDVHKARKSPSLLTQIFTGPGFDSEGRTSKSSNRQLDKLVKDKTNQLNQALQGGDPKKIQAIQNSIQQSIIDQASGIAHAGGNDANAQTVTYSRIAQLRDNLEKQGVARLAALAGLKNVDVLTQQQILGVSTYFGQISGLNAATLNKFKLPNQQFFNDVGVDSASSVGKNLLNAADGNNSFAQRAVNTRDALGKTITNEQIRLNDRNQLPFGDPNRATALQKLQTDEQAYQAAATAALQAPQAEAEGSSTLLAKSGNFAAAASKANAAVRFAQAYADSIKNDDPAAYYAAMQHVQDLKSQAADLESQSAQNAIALKGAAATDPVTKANLAIQAAQLTLQSALKGGDASKIQAARLGLTQSQVSGAATGEQLTEAQTAATTAGIRNPAAVAQANLNEALRKEAVYSSAKQKNDVEFANAKAQEAQARIALSDAVNADAQSLFDSQAALQSLQGNDLGAAETNVAKAQQQYAYAVGAFGANSAQAQGALAQTYAAQQNVNQQVLAGVDAQMGVIIAQFQLQGNDVGAARATLSKANQAYALAVQQTGSGSNLSQNAFAQLLSAQQALNAAIVAQSASAIDLTIARLNARGGLGDATAAAQLEVTKAQQALAAFRRAGGQSGTTQSNNLLAAVATAQRAAFDTALNAQLDTLDFQKQTYQITSIGEVQALQQILKNKQLTLAEQRSITLKIKDLQNSIRQQLTNGGLNIPSDIKLPTAYEVRRSLGAGFGGAGTTVAQVNNNQKTSIVITQNVPTAAVATQIANHVIKIISQQTGQQVRANSTTPRLVGTR